MDKEKLTRLLVPVRRTARAAGQAILAVLAEGVEAETKADGSPLTRADTASDAAIAAGLKTLEPAVPIVSEEGDLERFRGESFEQFWLVDPLDGTKELLKGLGEYTVNIALICDGEPILGVIVVPATGVGYFAARGVGAFKVPPGGEPRPIHANQCEHPRSAVASRSHLSEQTKEYLARLNVTEIVRRGSSLKFCAVAEGQADIYPRHGPTWLWDSAAGAAIAREAGCRVVDLAGRPLTYGLAGGMKHSGFIVYPCTLRLPAG